MGETHAAVCNKTSSSNPWQSLFRSHLCFLLWIWCEALWGSQEKRKTWQLNQFLKQPWYLGLITASSHVVRDAQWNSFSSDRLCRVMPNGIAGRRHCQHVDERARMCSDKLHIFKHQLSLMHYLHLWSIRLSPITIMRHSQPSGTLGK